MNTTSAILPGDRIAPFVILCGNWYYADIFSEKLPRRQVIGADHGFQSYNTKLYGVDVSVVAVSEFQKIADAAKRLFTEYDVKLIVWIGFANATTRKYDLNTVVISQNACVDDAYALYTMGIPSKKFSPCAPFWLIDKARTAVKVSGHTNRLNCKIGTVLSVPNLRVTPHQMEGWNELGVRALDLATAELYAAAAYHHGDAIALNLATNYTSNVYNSGEANPEDAKLAVPYQEGFNMLMDIALNVIFEWGRR